MASLRAAGSGPRLEHPLFPAAHGSSYGVLAVCLLAGALTLLAGESIPEPTDVSLPADVSYRQSRRRRFTSTELPGRFPTVYAGQRLNHRESGGMADAPDLGSGARKGVGVRLPPLAQSDQAVPAATSTTSMPRPGLLPLSLPLTPETRAAPGHPRGDRHDLLQRGRDLRREPDALQRIVEVGPGRRAPARRVDRPDVDADERALPLGQLPPSPFGARSLRWK